jgi:hypothetical protein
LYVYKLVNACNVYVVNCHYGRRSAPIIQFMQATAVASDSGRACSLLPLTYLFHCPGRVPARDDFTVSSSSLPSLLLITRLSLVAKFFLVFRLPNSAGFLPFFFGSGLTAPPSGYPRPVRAPVPVVLSVRALAFAFLGRPV